MGTDNRPTGRHALQPRNAEVPESIWNAERRIPESTERHPERGIPKEGRNAESNRNAERRITEQQARPARPPERETQRARNAERKQARPARPPERRTTEQDRKNAEKQQARPARPPKRRIPENGLAPVTGRGRLQRGATAMARTASFPVHNVPLPVC